MQRLERKIMKLNDKIAELREEHRLVTEELSYHRHINDDAQRDAAIGSSDDRSFAKSSARDVERFERSAIGIAERIEKIALERDRLLVRLGE